ncbi:hypothetical protein SASPL_131085 [Salvia splendens]|uniref:UBR-type domain-containing protein n=1 Tax=Salvia splendens TaxID=180675 RepID=A0A8X8X840_SALSN|nr:hypothetical protein SASPL_131085 [Salvia splendens]
MSDVFDDEVEAEPTISIGDYLKSVEEEELEADLILGGDEGKECTYGKGYVKRQAIFSCLTCTPDGNAGVCTACSLVCHDGHEILELWTKRNFRCDCGNSKFGEVYCKLLAGKDVENTENMYNHNFKGTYCTCDLPYPDPNVEEQVEMIQCCICEDWFHEEHIGLQSGDKIPRDEEGEPLYEDFICQGCSVICSFLTCYPQIISASDPSDTGKEKAVENSVLISSDTLDEDSCSIGIIENLPDTGNSKPLFLSKEDSIAEYEKMGQQKRNENIQKLEGAELNFMNNLGHVEKMEILSGIADMKNEIFSFLESSDPSKPVTTADHSFDILYCFMHLKVWQFEYSKSVHSIAHKIEAACDGNIKRGLCFLLMKIDLGVDLGTMELEKRGEDILDWHFLLAFFHKLRENEGVLIFGRIKRCINDGEIFLVSLGGYGCTWLRNREREPASRTQNFFGGLGGGGGLFGMFGLGLYSCRPSQFAKLGVVQDK